MRILLLTISLFAFLLPLKAQISSYDISTFQEPNRQQKRGGVEFDARFQTQNQKADPLTDSEKMSAFNANIGAYDARFSDQLLTESSSNSSFYARFSSGSDNTDNSGFFNTNFTLGHNMQKRWFNESLRFFGLGFQFVGSNDIIRNRFEDTSENYSITNNYVQLALPLSVGKGQPQNTNDAWHAITILEFLEVQGMLSKPAFSDDEIIAFANELSLIRNVRNTDPRLERITEVERLANYLVDNNMVNSTDYRFFAHVHDAWIFENFEARESGTRLSIGLEPDVIVNQNIDRFDENDIITRAGVDLFIAYDFYKPLSLDWQFDLESKLSVGPSKTFYGGDLEILNSGLYLRSELSTNIGIGHFLNRRTFWEVDFRPSLVNVDWQDELTPNGLNSTYLNAWLTGQYLYYFSPQFSMNVRGSVNLNRQSGDIALNPFYNRNEIRVSSFYRFY